MPITYRQARPSDMLGCARVFVRSSRDLARRQGNTPAPARPREAVPPLAHLQRTDPRGFHVAVKDGRVVAFAATIVRGHTHFLSMFWTLPGLQGRGVGRRVLAGAFAGPRPPASAVRCVFASLDTRAQMLYLKFGMRPRGMFYLLKGPPNGSPQPGHPVELQQVGKPGRASPQMLAIAARFDRRFRGTRRDVDIRWVMSLPGARFFTARAGRKVIGYAIVNDKGRVGPAGVVDPRYSAGLAWAIKEVVRGLKAKEMFAVIPGTNTGAISAFLDAGLKTDFFGAWMSAKPVGSFDGYILAGGMLL